MERRRRQNNNNNNKKKPPMPNAVMRLYRACRDVFSNSGPGIVPSEEDVEKIRSVLDVMTPTDVDVSPNMPYFRNDTMTAPNPVTYLHLYECDKFSIGIFCLPPSSVIPLHNHPGMTVFSKLLFGSMHIKSYDWVDVEDIPRNSNHAAVDSTHLLAKVKTDAVFTAPCDASILYPASDGNMHCFTAVTSCVVLDVLGPPYSDTEGRHCTYYNVFPYENISNGGGCGDDEYAWLEAREKPEDFIVGGAPYTGPTIVRRIDSY